MARSYANIFLKGGEAVEQEQKWIRAIQRHGSREAAEHLIGVYYDEIYRFVYRQTGSREDALDLTQSIFIAALRSLPGYRAVKASFRTWLYRIAANKVIDARRKSRPVSLPIEEMELPVFRLRIYGEKTFPEIAASLRESEAAVKSRYYRLIGRLRKEFGSDEI